MTPGASAPRLLAQRGFFTGPIGQVPVELYSTVARGNAVRHRDHVVLEPFSAVSMKTFFGRFPAGYWQRWTPATDVRLEVTVSGSGTVSLHASDAHGAPRVIHSRPLSGADDEVVTVTAALDRFVDGGALWLEAATDADRLSIREVRWSVAASRPLRPTAVVVCTFNRPDDCIQTLGLLGSDPEVLEMLDAVYVIDQGTDTVASRDAFGPIAAQLGSALQYRTQPNLGGAGGFTRGLYEVADGQHSEHANVLFMDDDIWLEPDTVVRLAAFAGAAAEPLIVGAQMLYLLHPDRVYSWAQSTDLPALYAGGPVPPDVLRVDVTREHELQDIRVDTEYNAWWCCLIPSEVVARAGYPLPMFFQWDDVEYGLRARSCGFPTVTLPGAAVWHEDWDWKDEDSWANYFNHRNGLIVAALHTDFDANAAARVIAGRMARNLVGMRYGLAETVLRAVEAFLDGPECLADGGLSAPAAVHAMRSGHPETHTHPVSAVPGGPNAVPPIALPPPEPSRHGLVMAKRFVRQLRGRSRGTGTVRAHEGFWWHVSQFETAVVTDRSRNGVRVRKVDRDELLRQGRRTVRVLRRLRKEGRAVGARYREELPNLTSRRNWQRLFEGGD